MSASDYTITRHNGVAGQVQYTATGNPDGELYTVSFVGTINSPGPVVMISHTGTQVFVTDPSRFGPVFDRAWVEAFLNS